MRTPAPTCLLPLIVLAHAPAAGAAGLSLDLVVREAELVVAGRAAGPADDLGLVPWRVERTLKRTTAATPAQLTVRLPWEVPTDLPALLFLVSDPLAPGLGAFTPLDPDAGIVLLDGRVAPPAEILAAVELLLDPPPDDAGRLAGHLRMLGQGDLLTLCGARAVHDRPEWHGLVGHAARAEILRVVESRRLGAEAQAALVDLVGALWTKQAGATLVELVAGGVPPGVADAVGRALSRHAEPSLEGVLRDALHRAPDAALPDLLRLAGSANAPSLLPELHVRLAADRAAVRHAAIAACGDLGSEASAPHLERLLSHRDPATRDLAAEALSRLSAPP